MITTPKMQPPRVMRIANKGAPKIRIVAPSVTSIIALIVAKIALRLLLKIPIREASTEQTISAYVIRIFSFSDEPL